MNQNQNQRRYNSKYSNNNRGTGRVSFMQRGDYTVRSRGYGRMNSGITGSNRGRRYGRRFNRQYNSENSQSQQRTSANLATSNFRVDEATIYDLNWHPNFGA
ncbi:uncharacterized protein LOC110263479 [Arachis ipaensis]|uniref:uncharacterized protein LOC110263479 n=1 Tax=Arachis ipaensis TaxID=130454 RepID=UPI000A2B5312|nr:uncharacterized protein LOC110263479 [Arachis ipaensis]